MRPYLTLAFAQLAVGAAAIFARFALTGAGALAVSAGRLTIAALVLLAIALVRRDGFEPRSPRVWAVFVAAGIALAVHFGSWIWSLEYTSVAISVLLAATVPVWSALYDAATRGYRLSAPALLSFAAGGAGLVLVVGWNVTRPPVAGHQVLGAVLAIASAIALSAYFVLVREVRDSFGTRAIVTQTYTWAALSLIVASLAAHQAPPRLSDTLAWGGILAMALVSQLLGHTALNAALRWFTPSAIGFTILLEPVVAALLAFAIFGERLTAIAIGGGLLVLGAVAVFIREERRGEARDEVKAAT